MVLHAFSEPMFRIILAFGGWAVVLWATLHLVPDAWVPERMRPRWGFTAGYAFYLLWGAGALALVNAPPWWLQGARGELPAWIWAVAMVTLVLGVRWLGASFLVRNQPPKRKWR